MKEDSQLCSRVAVHLAALGGHGEIVWHDCPDEREHTQQAVDFVARAADGTDMAFEHTKIESYTEQLHEARQIEALLLPLEHRVAGQLPTESMFWLSVGIGAVANRDLDPEAVQAGLQPWIVETAPTLVDGFPATKPHHQAHGCPPDIPVEVTLTRWPLEGLNAGGRLHIMRASESDEEAQAERRRVRLAKALSTKLPKLNAHAPHRTVLVLEDVDLAMSNSSEVWVGLQTAAQGLDLCDTIILLDTSVRPVRVTVLYSDGAWHPDFAAHTAALPPLNRPDGDRVGPTADSR